MKFFQKPFAKSPEASESVRPMMSPETTESEIAPSPSVPTPKVITDPDFSGEPVPIGQWTERADYPQCTLGHHVSIHGFAGVVVEIVNQSIKLRSADGITQRFNAYRLKTLFAPPDRTKPAPQTLSEPPKAVRPRPVAEEPEPELPARVFIANPTFDEPVRPIRAYAGQADFPQCVYGKHVDIPGYAGVVVEIVKGSLKVQSPTGTIRSYNVDALKKLYGRG